MTALHLVINSLVHVQTTKELTVDLSF